MKNIPWSYGAQYLAEKESQTGCGSSVGRSGQDGWTSGTMRDGTSCYWSHTRDGTRDRYWDLTRDLGRAKKGHKKSDTATIPRLVPVTSIGLGRIEAKRTWHRSGVPGRRARLDWYHDIVHDPRPVPWPAPVVRAIFFFPIHIYTRI